MKVSDPIIERALNLYPNEIRSFMRTGKDGKGNPYLDLEIDGSKYRFTVPISALQPA